MRRQREGDYPDRPIRDAESFMPRKPLDGMRRRAMLHGERELGTDRAGAERTRGAAGVMDVGTDLRGSRVRAETRGGMCAPPALREAGTAVPQVRKTRKPVTMPRAASPDRSCCEDMRAQLSRTCADHPDPADCPDSLVGRYGSRSEYGLRIHDGGSSFVAIRYCPWCGTALKAASGRRASGGRRVDRRKTSTMQRRGRD